MLRLRSGHLPRRNAVEIDPIGAGNNGSQVRTAMRVSRQGRAQHTPINIGAAFPDGDPDFRR